MATDEQTRKLAYTIWEEAGRPNGKDTQIFFRAKEILESFEERPSFAHELDRQYSRLYFFLISAVLLVMAYVSLAVSGPGMATHVGWLGQSIAALGAVLSFVFLVINYTSAEALRCAKEGQTIDPVTSIGHLPKDMLYFLASPLASSKRRSVSYTWFIPAVLCIFWTAAWWIMFSWIGPVVTVLSVAGVSFIYGLAGRVKSPAIRKAPVHVPGVRRSWNMLAPAARSHWYEWGHAIVRQISWWASKAKYNLARLSFVWAVPKKAPQASTVKET